MCTVSLKYYHLQDERLTKLLLEESASQITLLQRMKKIIAACLAKLTCLSVCFGQSAAIKGRITDTSENKLIENAVVSLLRTSDSVLFRFSRSGSDGAFNLQNVPAGDFLLLISRPDYADHVDRITIRDSSGIDMGNIAVTPRSKLLQEVIVRQRISPLRIKGDTVEYLADSFKLKHNASVEDLLRMLPGMQVDKKGEIVAQGKRVEKILVDGEEFFSEDPTVVTLGLRADVVGKVQLFDKKSKQAEFAGIDDGNRTKTLNLQLKDDKKKGYFGKAAAGSDMNRYYDNSIMFNAFKGRRKLSFFGQFSKNGKTGLSSADDLQDGSDEGTNITVDANAGIPESRSANVQYSNTWNDDGHFNGNYKYNAVNVNPVSSIISQNILKDTVYQENQQTNTISKMENHSLSAIYDIKADSLSSFQFYVGGSIGKANAYNTSVSETFRNGAEVNNSNQTATADANSHAVSGSVLWQKKISRQGRAFSAQANVKTRNNAMNGFLLADNHFYEANGSGVVADTVDQKKAIANRGVAVNSELNYTEVAGKNVLVGVRYGLSVNNQESRYFTYGKVNGKYDAYIDSLSNQYSYRVIVHTGGLTCQIRKSKILYNAGANITWSLYRQADLKTGSPFSRDFVNIFPHFDLQYKGSNFKRITFEYKGSSQQPTLQQVRPLRNNNDPLNIYIGNPALQPAFKHHLGVAYSDLTLVNSRYINGGLSFDASVNDISDRSFTDTLGRKINQSVNVKGSQDGSAFFYYSTQAGSFSLSILNSITWDRHTNFVNNQQNITNTTSYTLQSGIGWHKGNECHVSFRSVFIYNYGRSSINSELTTRYWTQEHVIEAGMSLPWKIEFNTTGMFDLRQRTSVFDKNNNTVRWNASMEKRVAKDALSIKFVVNDILDQNKGFSRMISNNQVTESNYNTLRRYCMLSLIWNFGRND